jgi:hypothetical protein
VTESLPRGRARGASHAHERAARWAVLAETGHAKAEIEALAKEGVIAA